MERLPFDYMNAAGWVKTVAHVREMVKIPDTTHVVVGSFTVLAREGNTGGNNFVALQDGSFVNALGLPNDGMPYLKKHGKEMARIIHDGGKLAVLSGAWMSPQEAGELACAAAEYGFDIYEDNRGCPNVFLDGGQKHIPSYHPRLMGEADRSIQQAIGDDFPVWEKLSPYTNPLDRVRESRRIRGLRRRRVTVVNTLPHCRPRGRSGELLITAKNTRGYGGLSGAGLKQLGLANAGHFAELLNPCGIGVNGAGGIRSGGDLEDYRRAGCVGMQVGGAVYAADRPKPLANIVQEWAAGRFI